jgi:hypothetical protein
VRWALCAVLLAGCGGAEPVRSSEPEALPVAEDPPSVRPTAAPSAPPVVPAASQAATSPSTLVPDPTALAVRCTRPGVPTEFTDLSYFPRAIDASVRFRRVGGRVDLRLSWTARAWPEPRAATSPWAALPAGLDRDEIEADPDFPVALAATHRMLLAELGASGAVDGRDVFVLATAAGVHELATLRAPGDVGVAPAHAWPLAEDRLAVLHRRRGSEACWVSVVHAEGAGAHEWSRRVEDCGRSRVGVADGEPALYDGIRLRRVPRAGELLTLEAPPVPETASLPLCAPHVVAPAVSVPAARPLHIVGRDAADVSEVTLDGRVASPTREATLELREGAWCLQSFLVGRDLLFARGPLALEGENVEGGGALRCTVVARTAVE